MFNKNVMKEMLGDIEESPIDGDSWYEKIINATNPEDVNSFLNLKHMATIVSIIIRKCILLKFLILLEKLGT